MTEDEAKLAADKAGQEPEKPAETANQEETEQVANAPDKEPSAAAEVSQEQVDDLKQQLESMSDKYLRAEAEIKNIQARNKKDQAAMLKYDGQQLAHDVLPVLDNLERALKTEVEGEQAQSLKKGVELVQQHLLEALNNNGVTEIAGIGERFDPTVHQAVQTVAAESDDQKETVVQVLQKGYQLKDRVLRPAMVAVAQ